MPKNLERNFELVAVGLILIFAIAVRIVTPPYQVADEINHFARAWQISEGKFLSTTAEVRAIERGDNPTTKDQVRWSCRGQKVTLNVEDEKFFVAETPRSMMPSEFTLDVVNKFHAINFDATKKFLSTPLNPDATEWHLIPNTGSYSPLAYFPQAVTAIICRQLNLNAGTIYYAMSLSALIFAATCVYLSMKLLPEKKLLIFLLASMPMFLVEVASISADAVIYGLCFLSTAWLLSLRKFSTRMTGSEIFGLIIVAVMLGLLKQVYGAILLLYFLIPRERFKSAAQFIGAGIFLLATELLVSTAWLYVSSDFGRIALFTGFYMGLDGIDVAAQKNFIFTHPIEFLLAFLKTLAHPDIWFAKTFFGVLGIVNVYFPKIFYVGCAAVLIIAASFGKLRLSLIERLIILFAAFITAFGIFAVEYLVWSSIGADVISGVQGRYFIPIALLTFSSLSLFEPPKFANFFAVLIGIFCAASTIWITFLRFY